MDLEYVRDLKLKYTMFYLFRKIEDKQKYIFLFYNFPDYAIEFIYEETKIECEFVKEIVCKELALNNNNNKIIFDFMHWLDKSFKTGIEKYNTKYKNDFLIFTNLTEEQIENFEILFEKYIIGTKQSSKIKTESPKEIKQALLF